MRSRPITLEPMATAAIVAAAHRFILHEVESLRRDGAVVGLSGGLDSAVVATLAARSLGPENVLAIVMPDRDSDPRSTKDALELVHPAVAERTGFEVRDVEGLREHYALTLRRWVQNLEKNREEALRQVDERTYRVWRLYMAGCSHAFTTARLSLHQALLARPDGRGRSELPWNRADLYI